MRADRILQEAVAQSSCLGRLIRTHVFLPQRHEDTKGKIKTFYHKGTKTRRVKRTLCLCVLVVHSFLPQRHEDTKGKKTWCLGDLVVHFFTTKTRRHEEGGVCLAAAGVPVPPSVGFSTG